MKRLGAEMELKDVDIKASTLKSQEIFFKLLLDLRPALVNDLMRLFNFDSLPASVQEDDTALLYLTKFFYLHTKKGELFSLDLGRASIKHEVRNTPVLTFFKFLFENEKKFEKLLKKSDVKWKKITSFPSKDLVSQTALDELLPSRSNLRGKIK